MLAGHEEHQRRRTTLPAQAKPAMHASSCAADRSAIAPTTGSSSAERIVAKRDEVEDQRAGGDREPEDVQVGGALEARRRRDEAAGGLLGDRGQVRREQHGRDRGDVGAVGPVVPVPGLLLPGARERAEVGDTRGSPSRHRVIPPLAALDEHVPEYVGAVGHQAVDTTVEQRRASRPGRRWSRRARACRRRARGVRARRVTTVQPAAAVRDLQRRDPATGEPVGEPAAGQEPERERPPAGAPTSAPGRRVRRRKARQATRRERPDQHPVPRVALGDAARRAAPTAPSDLRSMLKRASGNSSKQLGQRRHPLAARRRAPRRPRRA